MRLLFILVIFFGCSNQDEICKYRSSDLVKVHGDKIFGTHKIGTAITEFRDKGIDSIQGGYYTFYNNGNLKSYEFFEDMQAYLYSEVYDSSGKLLSQDGNPLVNKLVQLVTHDSIEIVLTFFSLNKEYEQVKVITDDGREIAIGLKPDSTFSNALTGSYMFSNLKSDRHIQSFIDVTYLNYCSRELHSFKDTISFYYRRKE